MRPDLSLVIAVLAAVGYAGGSTLQSTAVNHRTRAGKAARTLHYFAGLVLDAIAWALSLVALHGLPVYVVQAVLASSLAFTVVFARIWQHAIPRGRDIAAIGALIPALAIIALAGREQSAPVVSHTATVGLTIVGVAAVAAVTAALAAVRHHSRRWASALALLAGLNFSATALAARAVHISTPLWHNLHQPLVWVVAATGIAGTLAYAVALERGPVGPATAQLWAVEVIVPAAVAIPLLGDTVRPGWLPVAAVAVLIVVAATAVLAGTPPLSPETEHPGGTYPPVPASPVHQPAGRPAGASSPVSPNRTRNTTQRLE